MNSFFLDFESNKAGQFYLVGFELKSVFEQRVLTDDLRGFAEAKGLLMQSLEDFVFEMLKRLRDDKLTRVAYSITEMVIIDTLLKEMAPTRDFADLRYLNLLSAAKRWIRKHRKNDFKALPPFRLGADAYTQRRQKYSLASVMRLTSFQAETDYAPGKTSSRFNSLS